MKALVFGATGCVGRAVTRQLIWDSRFTQVVGTTRKNSRYYEDIEYKDTYRYIECYADLIYNPIRLISQYKPDIIFNCTGNATANSDDNFTTWHTNVDSVFNILESCRKLNYKVRFIQCSSIYVQTGETTLYATSKRAAEHLVTSYKDYSIIDGRIVRFPAVAGVGARHGVVKAVLDKLLNVSTDTLKLLTNSSKPLVYANELAEKLVDIATDDDAYHTTTLCSPNIISVGEIAELAMNLTNIRKKIEWTGSSWPGDMNVLHAAHSLYNMYSAREACTKAIKDILREEYDY